MATNMDDRQGDAAVRQTRAAPDAHLADVERALLEAALAHYGPRLVALAVFGSAGRGTIRHDSDIDILVVAEGLPPGRVARSEDFVAVDRIAEPSLARARASGRTWYFSPVYKTPVEAQAGSPLFLDMTEDARILYDPTGFLDAVFERLRQRLKALGSRRIWRDSAWFWDLKPDYVPGEVFEL